MIKFRINKALQGGYNLYVMHDMGVGWDKEYHSHYETKEQAERMLEKLQFENDLIKSFKEK